jgi:DNA-binding SARP family transcriptional activator/tetratricopeptide (TPR) repeat protein
MAPIEFRVLGPLEAWSWDDRIDLGHAKQRSVLAILLVEVGRVVHLDQLIDRVWGDSPPATARNIVYGYITRLRTTLAAVEEIGDSKARSVVQHRSGGYCVDIDPDQIDLHRFRRLVAEAHAVEPPDQRARLLRSAIDLWRGRPFADLTSAWLHDVAETAEEELWAARLDESQARLDCGEHTEVLLELRALATRRPLDEQLAGLLMLAAYRAGQQAEALDRYHAMRRRLDDDLGIVPGPALAQLYQRILRNDPDLLLDRTDRTDRTSQPSRPAPATTVGPVPAQLPHDVPGFAGRDEELARLEAVCDGRSRSADAAVPIVAIDGTAGVGKTALAVRFAHRVAHRFPDGQLYVDLRGFDPHLPPMTTGEVLGGFLRALGAEPARVPADPAEQAALFRTMVQGRRLLMVLDNATDSAQVRPLIPGHPGCLVIVTGRNRLAGLAARDGALRLTLDVLTPASAGDLLETTIGDERPSAEPDAVAELALLCGRLPLALRIAAERANAYPASSLGQLAGELAAEHNRLDLLVADDDTTAVRAVFSWSYRVLPAAAARMFRLLGLHAGTDFSTDAVAALVRAPRAETRRLLTALADTHLITEHQRDRYRLHDLLRVYAEERALAEETPDDREQAISRSLNWYLYTADLADRLLIPQRRRVPLDPAQDIPELPVLDSYDRALAWCDTEQANLVAATQQAARTGHDEIAWRLPAALWGFFTLRKPYADWFSTNRIGLAAARRVGDRLGEANILGSLGFAHWDLRQHEEAVEDFRRALRLCREAGNRWGEGIAMLGLGLANWGLDRHDEALRCYRAASAIWQEVGDVWCEGHTLNNLGVACRKLGRHAEAVDCFRRVVAIFQDSGDRWGESWTLDNLGDVHLDRHEPELAIERYRAAIALRRAIGDRHGEGESLYRLGVALSNSGDAETARESWQAALAIFQQLGDQPWSADVLHQLAAAGPS